MATTTLRSRGEAVLLLGAPGAGKGTQARFLAQTLGVPHVASGDLLREHRARGTDLGKAAQVFMDRGDLVPDDLVVEMIIDRLNQPDAEHGVLLDGFPRTLAQGEALEARLARSGARVGRAVYVQVPSEVLIERLAGRWICRGCQTTYHEVFRPASVAGTCDGCGSELYQRSDDARAVVANRVEVYLRETMPVIERYQRLGILRQVDGNRSVEQVKQALLEAVGEQDPVIV